MLFDSTKVSSSKVLEYYSKSSVLEHYTEATEKVGLWNSEKIVFQKSLKDKSQRILELGCGTGRISFGLAKLGYANLVCSDFSRKMVTRAKELNQRFGTGIKFEKQDATNLSYAEQTFSGIIFGFNGLMQIPERKNRLKVMSECLRVLKSNSYFIFTAHDRSLQKWKKFWVEERKKWRSGKQDPKLLEFGDRFEETSRGMLYIHVPDVDQVRSDLIASGFLVEGDFLRSKVAPESELTQKYSDECRFWICRKPA